MTETNNPAGRLLNIINAGKKAPGDKQAAEIWAELLTVPISDNSLLLRRVGYVMALPSQIREQFEELNNLDKKIYLKWLPSVEASFSILNFQMPWKQFIERFDGSVIYGMEICSDLLSRERPEKVAEEDLLSELKNAVDELISKSNSEEIEIDLRKILYGHLLRIKLAIEEYQIRGIVPLEEEFHTVLGEVVLNPDIYKESKRSGFGRKFWDTMGKLALVVTVTVGAIQIGHETISLLPTGEDSIDGAFEGEVIENETPEQDQDDTAIQV